MTHYVLPIAVSLSGGVVVGGALAAFISLLEITPRLVQISKTNEYVIFYQYSFIIGAVCFICIYFSDRYIYAGQIVSLIISLFMGTFTGLFSSALAEVLNVLPVISKKFKVKDELKWIIYFVMAGKVLGSLYFWTIF